MTTPRFSAESTLYQSRAHYQALAWTGTLDTNQPPLNALAVELCSATRLGECSAHPCAMASVVEGSVPSDSKVGSPFVSQGAVECSDLDCTNCYISAKNAYDSCFESGCWSQFTTLKPCSLAEVDNFLVTGYCAGSSACCDCLNSEITPCTRQYVAWLETCYHGGGCCEPEMLCQPSIPPWPGEYCCPNDQVPCNGNCVTRWCPFSKQFDANSCQCVCRPHLACPPGSIFDSDNCTCVCPDGGTPGTDADCSECGDDCRKTGQTCCPEGFLSPEGFLFNRFACTTLGTETDCKSCGDDCSLSINTTGAGPFTCCATGSGGYECTQLGTVLNCSGCGKFCGPGFGIACCYSEQLGNYQCTQLGTRTDCAGCGDACPADSGKACCFMEATQGYACMTLGTTDTNCGCGVDCTKSKQHCCDQACVNLGVDVRCASCNDNCAATGRHCCPASGQQGGFACSDTSTDPYNCGTCGRICNYFNKKTGQFAGLGGCSKGHCTCPKGQVNTCGLNAAGDQLCCLAATPVCFNQGDYCCAQGQILCGGQCCDPQSCCNGVCCPPGNPVCCNGQCGNQCSSSCCSPSTGYPLCCQPTDEYPYPYCCPEEYPYCGGDSYCYQAVS